MSRRAAVSFGLSLLLITASCFADEPAKPAKPPELEACKLGEIQKISRLEKIFLAGQPSAADLELAKKQEGIKTVINLRMPDELDWDEAGRLKDLGITYHHLPFRTPDSLKDEIFTKSRKVLSDKKSHPVLLHCASANRVGAVWLVHRVLDDKVSYEKALEEAKKVGLKSADYEAKARDYIARESAKK
jgi:uncharacterized protein (TIGR01244 family)